MFGMVDDLAKAAVGVVVETPVSIAADIVTMGGVLNDKEEPHTVTALKRVKKNIDNATEQE